MKIKKTTIHFSGGSLDGQIRIEHGEFPRSFAAPAKYKDAPAHETYVRRGQEIDTDAGTCVCHMDLDQIQMLPLPDADARDLAISTELMRALTAAIHKAGCPGSSVELYGLIPAVEAIIEALHRVQEQHNLLQNGAAYKQLSDACDEQQSHIQRLGAALGLASSMLEQRPIDLAKIKEWRALIKKCHVNPG